MPFEVINEPCNMESGDAGQAMIYKIEGDERTPFACHADEASAYAAITAIEAAEADKQIDDILSKMENIMVEEEEDMKEDMIEEEFKADLGDMVQFMDENGEIAVGVIENMDEEANVYTVRVYAVAGDEYEPTDQVLDLSGEDLMELEDVMEDEPAAEEMMADDMVDEEEDDATKSRIMARLRYMKASEEVNDEEQKVGVIEGYASTYGNTDLGGDVVEKGAFKQTLKHKGGIVPLLLDHGYKTQDVAGLAILEDDEKGLYMKAEMPLDIPEIQNAYRKIKFMIDRGGKMGLSIGYDTVKAMPGDDGVRKLKELALHEVSITPFPMNTEAQIMAAKARKKSAVKSSVTRRKAVTISRGKTSTDKPKQTTNLRRAK